MDEEKIDSLWEQYRENRTKANREKLILYYLGYVRAIAVKILERIPKNALELNDLINAGIFGLIDAIEKYDHTKGVKF
ncbi:MAG: sigma-70 family RNA polymerase sigma factor, partial [Planctomycetota bacterium]